MFCGDAHITTKCLFQTTAVGVTVNRRDNRFVEIEQERKEFVLRFLCWTFDIIRFYITASAEGSLACSCQDADSQGRIVAKLTPDIREHLVGLKIAGVESFRPIDGDSPTWAF